MSIILVRRWALAFAAAVLLAACQAGPAPDFNGAWDWSGDQAYFTLNLEVRDGTATGRHEGGLADGSRIDAALPGDEPSVNGKQDGSTLKLTIRSAYSPETVYEAELTLAADGAAQWRVTKDMPGETFIPREARLVRRAAAAPGKPVVDSNDDASLMAQARTLQSGTDRTIADQAIQPVELPLETNGGTGASVAIWRDGKALLKIMVAHVGDNGQLVSSYYFGPGNEPVIALREYSTPDAESGELVGSVETTSWFFRKGEVALARDGQDNPLALGAEENAAIVQAINEEIARCSALDRTQP